MRIVSLEAFFNACKWVFLSRPGIFKIENSCSTPEGSMVCVHS